MRYNKNISRYKLNLYNPDDLCGDIYNNCVKVANGNYTKDILNCTVSAIGLGSITGGVGGVVFQIACGVAAYSALGDAKDACTLNYKLCMKNQ